MKFKIQKKKLLNIYDIKKYKSKYFDFRSAYA